MSGEEAPCRASCHHAIRYQGTPPGSKVCVLTSAAMPRYRKARSVPIPSQQNRLESGNESLRSGVLMVWALQSYKARLSRDCSALQ